VQVRLRRAPRYRAFVGAGALLGAVAGIVARLLLGDPTSVFSAATTTGYLAAIGLLLGGLAGGAVAVLVERPGRRPGR
jgi:HAMP domain-containing protein